MDIESHRWSVPAVRQAKSKIRLYNKKTRILTSRLPPEKNQWGTHPMLPDRNNSLSRGHTPISLCLDICRLERSLAGVYWWAALLLPESNRAYGWNAVRKSVFCYPIPTHSKHSRTALLNTVSISPRITPKHSITIPANNSVPCKSVFFFPNNWIPPSVFWLSIARQA